MTKFYQACFTRLGGNDISSGWQTLNVSEGMPRQIKELFECTARGDQPADYGTPKDSAGNPLCLLEITGDGANMGICRVQYGLSDAFGRENMYCHGYMFPNAYELLKDPNKILGISDSNFHFTPEQTQKVPQALEMGETFTISSALQACRMDTAGYVRYIGCVYYALATNAKTTVYVRTDGSDRMARALLYLAYSAVPYSLRPKITAETYANPNTQDTMLVMCQSLPDNCMFIDPVSGETNILTASLQNRWSRYPFVTFFAQNHEKLGENISSYFDQMEDWLTKMGDPYLKNMDTLRLAFVMMTGGAKEDAAGVLYDWLVLPVPNTEILEQTVCDLLKQIIDQDIQLGSDTEKVLIQRLEAASSRELVDLGHRYHGAQMLKKPAKDAAASLANITPESPLFNALREILSGTGEGTAILREYYLRKAKTVAFAAATTYEDLSVCVCTFSDLAGMDDVWKVIIDKAVQIAQSEVENGSGYDTAAEKLQKFFVESYPAYMSVWEGCMYKVASHFDELFRTRFDATRTEQYEMFYGRIYANYHQFAKSAQLWDVYKAVKSSNYMTVSYYIVQLCQAAEQMPETKAECSTVVNSLMQYAMDHGAAIKCQSIVFWVCMANALDVPEVEFMVQKEAQLWCDPEWLMDSLERDEYWEMDQLQRMQESYKSYVEKYQDNTYKRSGDLLNREIKNRLDEAKKQEKDRKRQERMEAKAEAKAARRSAREEDETEQEPEGQMPGLFAEPVYQEPAYEETSYDTLAEKSARRKEKKRLEEEDGEKSALFSKFFGGRKK